MESRTRREIERLVQQAGLKLIDRPEQARSGHIKARLQAPDGRTEMYVFSCSPSDTNTNRAALSMLRRFRAGQPLQHGRQDEH